MQCPKCHDQKLQPFSHELVDFDFCSEGCKGIWCDAGELAIYLELSSDLPSKRKVELEGEKSGQCPRCEKNLFQIPYLASKASPNIDVCGSCNGIWLDFKELGELQKLSVFRDNEGKIARVFKHLADNGFISSK